jgi:hypothetical protein
MRTATGESVTFFVRPMARSSTSIPKPRSKADGNAQFLGRAAWWIVETVCVILGRAVHALITGLKIILERVIWIP